MTIELTGDFFAEKFLEETNLIDSAHDHCEEDARRDGGYFCRYCGYTSSKESWGAGRVTCPRCKKVAPSPAEILDIRSRRNSYLGVRAHPNPDSLENES